MMRKKRFIDEPAMSDKSLLVSVEDLISTAFGPMEKNTVNFKLIQTILHILARQLRLLEQDVEVKFEEIDALQAQQADDADEYDQYTSSSSQDEETVREPTKRGRARGKKERAEIEGKREKKERGEKEGKGEKKERGEKEGKGEKKERGEKEGKGEKKERGEKEGKGEKKELGEKEGKGQKERGEKGAREGKHEQEGKREREGKGEREEKGEREGKGERGEKGEKKEKRRKDEKEDGGRGETSSKDKDGKGGSKDRDGKTREDIKRKGRESPGRSPRDRKGDDSRNEGEEPRAGRERGGRHDDRKSSPERGAGRQESGTSITVTETTRRGGKGVGDKILVAERGPASRAHPARVGSIEVVTASQFALLERAVKQLEQATGPAPVPALPDNEQLRKDLAEGRASLSETMQAVQLNARVQAAEQGLSRMAELLTQLAMAGALPLDLASRIRQMQTELNQAATAAGPAGVGTARFADTELGGGGGAARFADTERSGGGGAARFADTERGGGGAGTGRVEAGAGRHGASRLDPGGRNTKSLADPSTMSRIAAKRSSVGSVGAAGAPGPGEPPPPPPGVTHAEMYEVLDYMKEAIIKEIHSLTARANHSADMASNMSRNVAEKLAVALQINGRITDLFSQTEDYAKQLSGFDSGLTTQMTSFQEQMTQIRTELNGGLTLLESANNNAETAAILDLSERYEGLVIELDNTVHLHHALTGLQQQLSDELRSLVQCVEMLREQKADRDEVLDGLRDKADISRIAGLLHEKDFAQARYEIEKRLAKCYEKFHKQNEVWQNALADLSHVSDSKADIITLVALKEEATMELNQIQEKLHKLEIMLGEPQAALLMRQLAPGAACGACATRAMMPPTDATHGQPCALPPLRLAPLGADECLREVKLSPPDNRAHTCRRWVGGSHTLMGGHVARQKADGMDLQAMPTRKFEGYGIDGKLYMMEEDLQPCAECNKLSTDESGHVSTPAGAGGDQA